MQLDLFLDEYIRYNIKRDIYRQLVFHFNAFLPYHGYKVKINNEWKTLKTELWSYDEDGLIEKFLINLKNELLIMEQ